jgi:hypothetical protein
VGGAIYLKNDAGAIFNNVSIISKTVQDTNQSATADQAIITHRTTDTVDDLSATPYGVQVMSGGLELINEVVDTNIFATATAKSVSSGGSADANHIKNYWESIPGVTADTTLMFYSDVVDVSGAVTADIWKGKAGSNAR